MILKIEEKGLNDAMSKIILRKQVLEELKIK
jgi:hypothetical protein